MCTYVDKFVNIASKCMGVFSLGTNDYGASWPMLITPEKAEMLVIDQAKTGSWLYRDGTANMLSCGVWEWMLVK